MTARVPARRLSGFYFAYFSILGVLVPYWPLFLKQIGHVPAQIGVIMALIPATKIFSPTLWGWLADRNGKVLRVIRWATFLSWVAFCGLFLDRTDLTTLVVVMLVFSFCWNATLPLFESVTLDHLVKKTALYSGIRLWGSVGFLSTVWVMGEVLDDGLPLVRLPEVIAGLMAFQWLLALAVPSPRVVHPPGENVSMLGILKRGEVLGFFLAAMLIQVAHGPYYAFYSVYLDDHGFSDRAIGQLWALGVIAEIILFHTLPRIHHCVSLRALLLGSLWLGVLRWLLIGWGVESLTLLVIAQMLHAATFGCAHAAAVHIVHRNFQGPHHAKGQSLYSAICYGLGGALGSLYSGELWVTWGPAWVFTAAAGCSLLALIIAWPRVGRE
jgi:PPP family 3-phenylpropionic acid transporter